MAGREEILIDCPPGRAKDREKGITMNKARRNQLKEIQEKMSELRDMIDTVLAEEQEAYDNLPESFQDSERGEAIQTAIEAMESAMESCEEAENSLEEAQEQ